MGRALPGLIGATGPSTMMKPFLSFPVETTSPVGLFPNFNTVWQGVVAAGSARPTAIKKNVTLSASICHHCSDYPEQHADLWPLSDSCRWTRCRRLSSTTPLVLPWYPRRNRSSHVTSASWGSTLMWVSMFVFLCVWVCVVLTCRCDSSSSSRRFDYVLLLGSTSIYSLVCPLSNSSKDCSNT